MCCSPWSRKESDTTERLSNDNSNLPPSPPCPVSQEAGLPWPPRSLLSHWVGWAVLRQSPRAMLALQLYSGGLAPQSPL